ncbi:hypothetical protein ACFLZN_00220 [Nanoarchaeota archaeon]
MTIDVNTSKMEGFLSLFRPWLDLAFSNKDYDINAQEVMQQLSEKKINTDKLKEFIQNLPVGEWDFSIFESNIKSLNELFGVSNEEIQGCVTYACDKEDYDEIRWRILLSSLLESSSLSKEFFDILKYHSEEIVAPSKLKLMNEVMLTFKLIHEQSKDVHKKFQGKAFSQNNLNKLNFARLPIEFLALRALYVFMHLSTASDKEIISFAELLAKERIGLSYQLHPSYQKRR